jgi:16S rRNA (cytosine967-C5)-methyltransferase
VNLAVERPDWQGRFQAILLDAPCSGLGTLARHADARWRIEPEAVSQLAAVQTQLLEAMVPLLAPGGRLLYATCTVHPMENQERIAAFHSAHPTWLLLREQQCWPGDREGGDGFYAALLQAS